MGGGSRKLTLRYKQKQKKKTEFFFARKKRTMQNKISLRKKVIEHVEVEGRLKNSTRDA